MITRYEITAKHPDGRAFLVAYAARKSRAGLLDAMQQRGAAIIAKLGIGDNDQMTFGTKPLPYAACSGWTIAFTGRTQLDAKNTHSQLPYIAD